MILKQKQIKFLNVQILENEKLLDTLIDTIQMILVIK